jgi:hypothetical protein
LKISIFVKTKDFNPFFCFDLDDFFFKDNDLILEACLRLSSMISDFAEKIYPFVIWQLVTKLNLKDEVILKLLLFLV